jgi:hypothetical protein
LLILQMSSNADEGEKIFKYYLILDGYFMEVVSAQIKGVGGLVGQGAPSDQALSKCSDNRLFVILSFRGRRHCPPAAIIRHLVRAHPAQPTRRG